LGVGEVRLVVQPELCQQTVDLGGIGIRNPIEFLEKMIVREDRGYQLAIGLTCPIVDAHPIENDFARIGFIQAGEQLQESRFDRTVAAGDEEASHSITSSARASKLSGMARPSVLTVLTLIVSSYLIGCCTGNSATFAPLRIRSTYDAARLYE